MNIQVTRESYEDMGGVDNPRLYVQISVTATGKTTTYWLIR